MPSTASASKHGVPIESGSEPVEARRAGRRQRRPSKNRQMFLGAIQAQITGTRILAALTFLVLIGSTYLWLATTTGSPVIGYFFAAMALALTITVFSFLQLMGIFTRKR
jgi:hypothetical protein